MFVTASIAIGVLVVSQPELPVRGSLGDLSGTLISGRLVAEATGEPIEQENVYIADGEFDGEFPDQDGSQVWGHDSSARDSAPGLFHFHNKAEMEGSHSVVYLWTHPDQNPSGARWFSQSAKTWVRARHCQGGQRFEAKITVRLRSSTEPFASRGEAIAQIVQSTRLQTLAYQSGLLPSPDDRDPEGALRERVRGEAGLVLALLQEADLYDRDKVQGALRRGIEGKTLSEREQGVLKKYLLDDRWFWIDEPPRELLETIRKQRRASPPILRGFRERMRQIGADEIVVEMGDTMDPREIKRALDTLRIFLHVPPVHHDQAVEELLQQPAGRAGIIHKYLNMDAR